jgi:hypothetical protein
LLGLLGNNVRNRRVQVMTEDFKDLASEFDALKLLDTLTQ